MNYTALHTYPVHHSAPHLPHAPHSASIHAPPLHASSAADASLPHTSPASGGKPLQQAASAAGGHHSSSAMHAAGS